MTAPKNYDIKDPALSGAGKARTEWASCEMPVIRLIRERFSKEKPLKGVRISGCLHITTETANLALTLKEGGAVILDASFIRSQERQNARRLAQRRGEVSASDGRMEILAPQKSQFEPVNEVPPARHVIIDTSQPPADLARGVAEKISRQTGNN